MNSVIVRRGPEYANSLFTDFFDDEFFTPHDVLMDKVFNKMFPNTAKELGGPLFESRAYPKVDIRETDTQFVLEAEIPGLTRDQVKVEVKEDSLVIRGEKRDDKEKIGKYNVREIKRSSFIRSFTLPPELVDRESVEARFQDGILEVSINKVKAIPPPKPVVKQINIK
jgi:HSP20 family protein